MAALWCLERSLTPEFGEGLALRWIRALADHPWRSGAALALLLAALGPWRPSRIGAGEPGEGEEGETKADVRAHDWT